MQPLDKDIQVAWVGHIAAHSGGRNNSTLSAEIAKGVSKSTDSGLPATAGGDFARLAEYAKGNNAEQFRHDVTYQLYYVTECLIWLWKRMPRAILLRDEGSDEVDKVIAALLRDLNAGTSIGKLTPVERAEISTVKQGMNVTPNNGVEAIVLPTVINNGAKEARLTAQTHEPPPPPPGWPPQA